MRCGTTRVRGSARSDSISVVCPAIIAVLPVLLGSSGVEAWDVVTPGSTRHSLGARETVTEASAAEPVALRDRQSQLDYERRNSTTNVSTGDVHDDLEELLHTKFTLSVYVSLLSAPDCSGNPDVSETIATVKGCTKIMGEELYGRVGTATGGWKGKDKVALSLYTSDDCSGEPLFGGSTGLECGECYEASVPVLGGIAVSITCPFSLWGLCNLLRIPLGMDCIAFSAFAATVWLVGTICWVRACCRRLNQPVQIIYQEAPDLGPGPAAPANSLQQQQRNNQQLATPLLCRHCGKKP